MAVAPALIRAVVEAHSASAEPTVVLNLAAPEGDGADLAAWTQFFQALHAAERHGWEAWRRGQPVFVFELWSEGGRLGARCRIPARSEELIRALLENSVPGLEIWPG